LKLPQSESLYAELMQCNKFFTPRAPCGRKERLGQLDDFVRSAPHVASMTLFIETISTLRLDRWVCGARNSTRKSAPTFCSYRVIREISHLASTGSSKGRET
jgi:hypothetical protein